MKIEHPPIGVANSLPAYLGGGPGDSFSGHYTWCSVGKLFSQVSTSSWQYVDLYDDCLLWPFFFSLSQEEPRPCQCCSPIWRKIRARCPVVLPMTRWIVGDGRMINFMPDSWISDITLARWPTFISMDISDSISITDLLLQDGSHWDYSMVTQVFGNSEGVIGCFASPSLSWC